MNEIGRAVFELEMTQNWVGEKKKRKIIIITKTIGSSDLSRMTLIIMSCDLAFRSDDLETLHKYSSADS